ncbi:MAG: hypothetical protein KDE09_22950 [Anaerolineales bacterium]|nr:hypothetical protein [Anaerolineales bacterium]
MRKIIGYAAFFVLLAAGAGWWWTSSRAEAAPATASLLAPAGPIDQTGFARATEPDNIQFPADLGPHDDYQTEWWYYTGNLESADGRRYGYQFTIFRRAFAPEEATPPEAASDWRTNQLYFAHFTISDIDGEAFYPAEKFSRGAVGLAGAEAEPYRVWIEDWEAAANASGQVELTAATDEVALNLTLTETMPPILHGDGGLSVKGPGSGNASYYYSLVQMAAEGTVTIGGEQFSVSGLSWKDHEYSTSALEDGAVGWDWFSLQLDDGAALMFFQIRLADGSLSNFSSGSYIRPDGSVQPLAADDWSLTVLAEWTSPHSGAVYPAGWRIEIPSLDLTLEGTPLLADQELNVSTIYWEGATEFSGARAGRPISALGYVELTGYAQSMQGRI